MSQLFTMTEEDSPSLSSTDYDQLTGKEEKLQDTVFGKAKRLAVLDKTEWAFLVLSTVSILAVGTMTIYKIVEAARDIPSSESEEDRLRDLFFAITLFVNLGFLMFYAWHGVIREREFELWAFIAAVIIIGAYIFWNFFITKKTIIKIVRLSVFGVGAIPIVILAYVVSKEFRWLEFRIVGADPILQKMFRSYSRCTTLILFDLQIAASLLIFVYHPLLNALLAEKILLPILVLLTLIMAIDVFIGIVTETRWMIWAWGIFALLEPIYIALKCVHLGFEWNSGIDHMLAGVVYAIAAVAIIVRGALAYYVDRCYQNFTYGLKDRAFPT
ncbi:uncharacterized protein LOC134197810 [Corticium candelabrum]|uniref:uncharacterized protein LOC134197810 n=1 Tax=Corticium candelabrum TaxID=121492 RepID=UPI002E256E09|nr:uncharacterized protein LOC134197810 [Corticium candelabrum]